MLAKELTRESKDWLHGLAYVYLQHQHYEDATSLWQALLTCEPHNTKIYMALAYTALKAANYNDCVKWLADLEEMLEAANLGTTAGLPAEYNLIKGKALWNLAETDQARALARVYLERKGS